LLVATLGTSHARADARRARVRIPVLIVAPREGPDSAVARSAEEIIAALGGARARVVRTEDLDDAEAAIAAHPALSCVVIGWNWHRRANARSSQTAAHPEEAFAGRRRRCRCCSARGAAPFTPSRSTS
jgi:hypothetical protein